MKYCMRCGTRLEESDNFCPVCGLRQWVAPGAARSAPEAAAQAADYDVPRPAPLLAASLILFFLVNPVGTPLAAAAMLLTAVAHSGGPHASGRLRAARGLCFTAGAADALTAAVLLVAALVRLVSGGL